MWSEEKEKEKLYKEGKKCTVKEKLNFEQQDERFSCLEGENANANHVIRKNIKYLCHVYANILRFPLRINLLISQGKKRTGKTFFSFPRYERPGTFEAEVDGLADLEKRQSFGRYCEFLRFLLCSSLASCLFKFSVVTTWQIIRHRWAVLFSRGS